MRCCATRSTAVARSSSASGGRFPPAARLCVTRGVVHAPDQAVTAAGSDAGRALLAELDATPFSPPPPADPALARALVREGALVDVDGIVFTRDAIGHARALL